MVIDYERLVSVSFPCSYTVSRTSFLIITPIRRTYRRSTWSCPRHLPDTFFDFCRWWSEIRYRLRRVGNGWFRSTSVEERWRELARWFVGPSKSTETWSQR